MLTRTYFCSLGCEHASQRGGGGGRARTHICSFSSFTFAAFWAILKSDWAVSLLFLNGSVKGCYGCYDIGITYHTLRLIR